MITVEMQAKAREKRVSKLKTEKNKSKHNLQLGKYENQAALILLLWLKLKDYLTPITDQMYCN